MKPMMSKPELLSPAGSLKNMRYAFAYGADAVYAGQPRYSLRVRNNSFDYPTLAQGISEAHQLQRKFYVVVNIAPHNAKISTFVHDLAPLIALQPDALIMSDPGLIMLTREAFPSMPIHLSVQANCVNWAAVKFWQQLGLTRIILSRELSLKEIDEIRQHVPDMELEVFVHGALCMAYSGRCLLSGYINKRDPNQGTCTNACRWQYKVQEGVTDSLGDIVTHSAYADQPQVEPVLGRGPSTNQAFLITDSQRPDQPMTAYEDEHGTYIMNSRDLRAIAHVEQLTKMGISSLKIEGRTKSFYYCARTAQLYRQAIDDAVAGRPFDHTLLQALEGLANRGYTDGFFQRHRHDSYQNYQHGHSVSYQQQFVGEFTGERDAGLARVAVKNKFLLHDQVEVMTPNGNVTYTLTEMKNDKKQAITVAPGDGHFVWIPLAESIAPQWALLIRNLQQGSTRQPHSKI